MAVAAIPSVTNCAITIDPAGAPIEPKDRNGLRVASRIMADKFTTISR